MAAQFKLPNLGENIDSGDVVRVLVQVGDQITKQQPLLELETDKAVIEVPSSMVGTVEEIHVKEGDKAEVGQLILTVEEGQEKETKKEKPESKPRSQKRPSPSKPRKQRLKKGRSRPRHRKPPVPR
jgi:pyruvate dehydrogenase E2 component (dihydrolipoamide acetyltransferase)